MRISDWSSDVCSSDLIVEQNFDFDLLTPGKLMEKAVGDTVTIVRTNPATGAETRQQAKVLATNGGVVLQVGDHIEVLRDDGLPARVIFDRVQDNLRARPTLSVPVDSARAATPPARPPHLTPALRGAADQHRNTGCEGRSRAVR